MAVIRELEETHHIDSDLGLYNKVGDLHLKVGNTAVAVDLYERAIHRYQEIGLPNNAIALCHKVLRAAPSRAETYLNLARLMLDRGFAGEAKQNFLEYANRMQKVGKLDVAFKSLKDIAERYPHAEEVRLLLAEKLMDLAREDEAREQLTALYADVVGSGDQAKTRQTLSKIKAIDPEFEEVEAEAAGAKKKRPQKTSDLVFLDLDEPTGEEAAADVEPLDVERTSMAEETSEEQRESVTGMSKSELLPHEFSAEEVGAEPVSGLEEGEFEPPKEEPEVESLEIESTMLDTAAEEEVAAEQISGLEATEIEGAEEKAAAEVEAPEPEVEAPAEEPPAVEPATEEVAAASAPEPEPAEVEMDIPELEVEVPEISLEADEEEEEAVGVAEGDLESVPDLELEPSGDASVDLGIELEEVEEAVPTEAAGTTAAGDQDLELEVPEELEIDVGEGAPAEEIQLERSSEAVPAIGDVEMPEAEEEPELEEISIPAPTVDDLRAQVAEDPDDPVHHRALGEALIEAGEREEGIAELKLAMEGQRDAENWERALAITNELLRLDNNDVSFHERKVQFVSQLGDRTSLIGAYMGLADALFRNGEMDRARSAYEQVLEYDPENAQARAQADILAPAEPEPAEAAEPAAPAEPTVEAAPTEPAEAEPVSAGTAADSGGDFVNLGDLILEDEPLKDTRMRVEQDKPTGDEDADFAEVLSQFKKGIEANIGEEDAEAHYDLGVAFKEMGLLDEAIAEFQKALRGHALRLKTSEALGTCFYEKGQFQVAATVLKRAIEGEAGGDEDKIGALYWLGRCEEEQGKAEEALAAYQRVFAVDINFQDISERVKALA